MIKKIAVAILVGIVVLVQPACREPSLQEVNLRIASSEKLSRIDEVCIGLPKPANFRQIKKGLSGNANVSIVYYQYISDMSFDAVKDFYKEREANSDYVVALGTSTDSERLRSDFKIERSNVGIVVERRSPSSIVTVSCID